MKWLLVLLVACGDGPGERAKSAETTLETFAQRMCECRNTGCSKLVIKEMAAWTKRPPTVPTPDPTVAAELMQPHTACFKRATERP